MRKAYYSISCSVSAIVILIILSGCTPTKKIWFKTGITRNEWINDRIICGSQADKLVHDQDLQPNPQHQAGLNTGMGYEKLIRSHNARKTYQKIYSDCLKRRGYRLVIPTSAKSKST